MRKKIQPKQSLITWLLREALQLKLGLFLVEWGGGGGGGGGHCILGSEAVQ